jgi:membrane-associated phospholipid phosphatase
VKQHGAFLQLSGPDRNLTGSSELVPRTGGATYGRGMERPGTAPTMDEAARRSSRPRASARLLVPVVAAAVLAVGWLADSAREHDGPSRVDPTTAAHVLQLRTPTLTDLARVLSFVGSETAVGFLAVVVFVYLVVRRDPGRAAVVALGIGGSAFLTVVLKLSVGRHRPGAVDRLGAPDSSYSFPSGHTLNTAVFVGLVIWLLWPVASRAGRAALVVGGVLLSVGVGASRVYLGYHWLTDVVASGLVAIAWLCVVWMLRAWSPFTERPDVAQGPPCGRTPSRPG